MKLWARSDTGVAELVSLPDDVVPGRDVFPTSWVFVDVTGNADIRNGWIFGGETFSAPPSPTVDALRAPRMNDIELACAAAITGGFSSAALGAAHWYGSKLTDQANLDADMMAAASGGASTTTAIACSADGGSTWSRVSHTAAQIGQVWADFRAWRIACQEKKDGLQTEIAAATAADDVTGVDWT